MPGGLPPFRITVGALDFTSEAENITFSNVDPGGYEMASFDLQAEEAKVINPGDRVRIMDGQSIVWEGRVAEPQKTIKHGWHVRRKVGSAITRVQAEGYGAILKDNRMSMVYVDRDLSRWGGDSLSLQLLYNAGSQLLGANSTGPDPEGTRPALIQTITGAWAAGIFPVSEAFYDAGPQNRISSVYYDLTTILAGSPGTFVERILISKEPTQVTVENSGQLGPVNSGYFFSTARTYRYAFADHLNGTGGVGVQSQNYTAFWRNLTVYGDHNLPGRGGNPVGFYPSDIAGHAAQMALQRGQKFRVGQVDTITSYIVPHYVQYTPIDHETIIADMAKIAYAHYGMWESDSIFDDLPTFTFRAYSSEADYFCSLADCDEADIAERLANLYTSANISYQDGGGASFIITVSLPNTILGRVDITRTVDYDIGLSNTAVAQVFANYVLQILFAQARTAGSVQLPKKIRDRNGAFIPAYRLKSGIHRLRISDAPTRAGLTPSSDRDSFRISRVESSVDTTSGQVTTRVELDAGPNLIETLQARFAIAQSLSSF